jgi:ketosteroid isomerase-like protein
VTSRHEETVVRASVNSDRREREADNPNIALVQRFFTAYADHDFEAMRNEILAPDVTGSIPGHHPLAGNKRGADEILAYFGELPRANFQAEPIVIAAEGDYVVDVHRGWAAYDNASLDMHWVLVYRIEQARLKQVENFAADQHAADAFYWRVWGDELAPLPVRIAHAHASD